MTPELVERRKPIWLALSELYLDVELEEDDFSRLANILRTAGLSWTEVERINVEEVSPVVISNLWSMAGAWIGFNEEPLYKAILSQVRKGPPRLLWSKTLWRRLVEWQLNDCLPKLAQHF